MFISVTITSSAEEDLSITRWMVESSLLNNGDLEIVEDITFKFNKRYNGVFREIILENTENINGIRVTENSKDKTLEYEHVENAKKGDNNVFVANKENSGVTVQIFSPANNEEKTFRLMYTVKNVAKKYNDIGEVYYKFLGSENDTHIDVFSVNITLSEKDIRNEVKFFAHGPLNGKIHKVSEDTINLRVEDVPENTFVESRILFPTEFIPDSQNTINTDAYSDIMNEEAELQEKIEEDLAKIQTRKSLFGNISVIIAIVQVFIFIFFIIKYRRSKDIYYKTKSKEIPDDNTPAVVSYISSAAISNNTIIATILDLYRKGYLKVDSEEKLKNKEDTLNNFTITKIKGTDDNLLNHENHFISWLIDEMGDGGAVTTKDIENYSKNKRALFTEHYNKWIQLIKKDAINKGYFDKSSRKYGVPLVILFPISLIISIIALSYENILGLFLMFTSILILIQGIILIARKSDYGYIEYKKWTEFKKHMKKLKNDDFKDNFKAYPKDITLIYGLALGINNDILNNFNIRNTNTEGGFQHGYGWMYWYFLLNNNSNNSFNQSINNSFNTGTTSVGGSGNFTAGGGGGIGGGGAGGF